MVLKHEPRSRLARVDPAKVQFGPAELRDIGVGDVFRLNEYQPNPRNQTVITTLSMIGWKPDALLVYMPGPPKEICFAGNCFAVYQSVHRETSVKMEIWKHE